MCSVKFKRFCFPGSGYGMGQSSRLSSSVSGMRVLNTGSDVEEALADALVCNFAPLPIALSHTKPVFCHTFLVTLFWLHLCPVM